MNLRIKWRLEISCTVRIVVGEENRIQTHQRTIDCNGLLVEAGRERGWDLFFPNGKRGKVVGHNMVHVSIDAIKGGEFLSQCIILRERGSSPIKLGYPCAEKIIGWQCHLAEQKRPVRDVVMA